MLIFKLRECKFATKQSIVNGTHVKLIGCGAGGINFLQKSSLKSHNLKLVASTCLPNISFTLQSDPARPSPNALPQTFPSPENQPKYFQPGFFPGVAPGTQPSWQREPCCGAGLMPEPVGFCFSSILRSRSLAKRSRASLSSSPRRRPPTGQGRPQSQGAQQHRLGSFPHHRPDRKLHFSDFKC